MINLDVRNSCHLIRSQSKLPNEKNIFLLLGRKSACYDAYELFVIRVLIRCYKCYFFNCHVIVWTKIFQISVWNSDLDKLNNDL